ncbi:MerR family transcriptional regulator [Pseudomonas sp. SID14000]|uniref:MerR family transcriptional regulator n=1 Tax=Pseudomonas sp. SID14000 TaxID=1986221 RepID=UPI000B3C0453|nr:MerR family transcriptional regulator [Pseudomonas sp. SID14000]
MSIVPPLFLQVGALAQRCGTTVRALHHYDAIGLIKPTSRTDAGYRLYDETAVLRVKAIQTLQASGLSLERIGQLMAKPAHERTGLIAERMARIDEEIAVMALHRSRLAELAAGLSTGFFSEEPPWPGTMALLERYRAEFSETELLEVFHRWVEVRNRFDRLVHEVRKALRLRLDIQSARVQRLAARWMDAAMVWMAGDVHRIRRWRAIHESGDHCLTHTGLDTQILNYIGSAVKLRMAALRRHLSEEQISRLDKTLDREWAALSIRANRLRKAGERADPGAVQEIIDQWQALLRRMSQDDEVLARKVLAAYDAEPLLQIGHAVPPAVREWLIQQQHFRA